MSIEAIQKNKKVAQIARWIKEFTNPLKAIGGLFFVLALGTGLIWAFGILGLFFIIGGLLAAQPPQEGGEAARPFRVLLKRMAKSFQFFTKSRTTSLSAASPSG